MKKIWKRIFMSFTSFILAVFTAVVGIFPTIVFVRADTVNGLAEYESRNVLEDLENSTINGESFSLKKYGFNSNKETQVLSFAEYCYSFYPEKQNNYGLYVYVYNPQGLTFDTDSDLNCIQFACGENTNTHYTKYSLRFLNCSTETNYERLFYKFKVVLTNEQRAEILSIVNSTERCYRVSGIELLSVGQTNVTDYTAATNYKYSGYAAGYGSNENADSTLQVSAEQTETLSLEVHSTQYRPEGTNGKNDYTQDSLHSVYFAVPNEYIQRYGEMTAIHATWLNAVLKPALVTGNWDAYVAVRKYLGEALNPELPDIYDPSTDNNANNLSESVGAARSIEESHTEALPYMYYGACTGAGAGFSNATCYYGYSYNALSGWSGHSMLYNEYGKTVNTLYMLFYAGSGTDSADGYTISSAELLSELRKSYMTYGAPFVNGKYSEAVFESVDEDFTEVNVQASETLSLTDTKITKAWWNGLFGVDAPDKVTATTFDGIKAVYPVKASDITGTNAEIAKRLYISENDSEEFKRFFEANKDESTVYLFRYQTSDYISQEATLYHYIEDGNLLSGSGWQKADTNAYFFQETVNLDFDIIDVTFTGEETETILPAVSDPIDVVPSVTPPVHTTTDQSFWDKLSSIFQKYKKLLSALLILAMVCILFPVVAPIVSMLVNIVIRIFHWIGKLLKKLFHRRE